MGQQPQLGELDLEPPPRGLTPNAQVIVVVQRREELVGERALELGERGRLRLHVEQREVEIEHAQLLAGAQRVHEADLGLLDNLSDAHQKNDRNTQETWAK